MKEDLLNFSDYRITPSTKDVLIEFVVLQHLRSKENLTSTVEIDEKSRKFLDNEWGIRVPELNIKESFLADLKGSKMTELLTYTLKQHICLYFIAEDDYPFITSDNPVNLIDNINDPLTSHGGFASRGISIVLPLTPKFLIVFLERSYWNRYTEYENQGIKIKECNVKYYNWYQSSNCNQYLFSNIKDFL